MKWSIIFITWAIGLGAPVLKKNLSVVAHTEGLSFFNFYRSFRVGRVGKGKVIGIVGYYTSSASFQQVVTAQKEFNRILLNQFKRQKWKRDYFKQFNPIVRKRIKSPLLPPWMGSPIPSRWIGLRELEQKQIGVKKKSPTLFLEILKRRVQIGGNPPFEGRFQAFSKKVFPFQFPVGEVGILIISSTGVRKIPLGVGTPIVDITVSITGKIGVLLDCSVGREKIGELIVLKPDGTPIGKWIFPNLSYQIDFTPINPSLPLKYQGHTLLLLFTNPRLKIVSIRKRVEEVGLGFFNIKTGHLSPPPVKGPIRFTIPVISTVDGTGMGKREVDGTGMGKREKGIIGRQMERDGVSKIGFGSLNSDKTFGKNRSIVQKIENLPIFYPPLFQFTATTLITIDGEVYRYPTLKFLKQLPGLVKIFPLGQWGVSGDNRYLLIDKTVYKIDNLVPVAQLSKSPLFYTFNGQELWITTSTLSALHFHLPDSTCLVNSTSKSTSNPSSTANSTPIFQKGYLSLPLLQPVEKIPNLFLPTPLSKHKLVGIIPSNPLKVALFDLSLIHSNFINPSLISQTPIPSKPFTSQSFSVKPVATYSLPENRVITLFPLDKRRFVVVTPHHLFVFKIE